ncbi:ABC transporter permease [Clostridia bacterium OttesenSCG-928-O13]|nr:ABC transporter permease [Clostridia bacterium OttesenSCG-928-O13]
MKTQNPLRDRAGDFLRNNNVTLMFILLCVGAFYASGTGLTYLLPELFTRIGRNTFMVLSLIVPVVAGLGLNFGIVIGAVAAQIAIFLVVLWGIQGLLGILLCVLICTPLAIFFGYLVGRLFNSMKGTEMVGGLVAGYFSDGLYQLLFLFIFGGVIPIKHPVLMIPTGMGVKNTINLDKTLRYAIDEVPMVSIIDGAFWIIIAVSVFQLVWRLAKKQDLGLKKLAIRVGVTVAAYVLTFIPAVSGMLQFRRLLLLNAIELAVLGVVLYNLYRIIRQKLVEKQPGVPTKQLIAIAIAGVVYACTYIPSLYAAFVSVRLPVLTYLCIAGLCVLIPWFMDTKLGQEMRTVGHSREVAASAGIDVNRTRIIAMIISTVLASYAQIISLQNIGTVATYGSHQQVGLYAIAALLVGGASVQRANVKQAVLGVILFHTLFILSPIAGKQLMGNAQIGEYFRVFVAYGVIALALAMHAWSANESRKKKAKADRQHSRDGSVPKAS